MRRGGTNRTSPMTLVLPVCIAVIILVIIVKAVMGGGSSTPKSETAAGGGYVQVTPLANAKVNIFMSSDSPKEISGPTKLFPEDKKVAVGEGSADIEIEGSTSRLTLEKNAELRYDGLANGKHAFTLLNGNVWVESPNADITVALKYFKATPEKNSVFIAFQNLVASNLYMLRGSSVVASEAASATVGANQMLQLYTSDSKTTNIAGKIAVLDGAVTNSALFKEKNGASILASTSSSTIESGSGTSTGSGASATGAVTVSGDPITFIYPEDQMTVDTATINIQGRINNAAVAKVLIGKKEAIISKEDKSFSLKDYPLPDASNDIAYKVYDEAGVLLDQDIITVNVSGKKAASTIKKADVVNYPVSTKDFTITSPGENPYKTTETSVKIRGSFAPDLVKYIRVNNYQLQQYKAFSTSWAYTASIDGGNMEEGVNEYLVTYYGPSDEVLATSKIYIVKETEKPAAPAPTSTPPVTPAAPSTTGTGSNPSL